MTSPGAYTFRMHVDGKVLTQTVTVKNDPGPRATAADLAALHALQMKLYNGRSRRSMEAVNHGRLAGVGARERAEPFEQSDASRGGDTGVTLAGMWTAAGSRDR